MEVINGVTDENVEEIVGFGTRIDTPYIKKKAPQQEPSEGEAEDDPHNR